MDVPRRHDGRAEAAGYANDNALVAHHLCDGLGGAEPVLDREHDGFGTEQCARSPPRRTHRLRRDHDQVDHANVGGSDVAPIRTTRLPLALHTQPVLANGGDVLGPGIDCPDVVAGITE